MKTFFYKIISKITYLLPLNFLIKLSGIKVIFPFYHTVSNNPPAHVKHLYKVRTVTQFRKDLDFLTKYYTSTQTVSEEHNKITQNNFYLSFDDGLSESYDVIFPILKEYRLTATFFLNSAFIDNKDMFYKYKASIIIDNLIRSHHPKESLSKISFILNSKKLTIKQLKKKLLNINYKERHKTDEIAKILNIDFIEYLIDIKPYLNKKQISELSLKGNIIAAHSVDHPLFSEIDLSEQIRQTTESIKYIKNKFESDNKLFAFPFTDDNVTLDYFNQIYDSKIADYTFGTAGIKDDIVTKNIQRVPIEKYSMSAKRYIKTEYLLYIYKRIIGKHRIKRN